MEALTSPAGRGRGKGRTRSETRAHSAQGRDEKAPESAHADKAAPGHSRRAASAGPPDRLEQQQQSAHKKTRIFEPRNDKREGLNSEDEFKKAAEDQEGSAGPLASAAAAAAASSPPQAPVKKGGGGRPVQEQNELPGDDAPPEEHAKDHASSPLQKKQPVRMDMDGSQQSLFAPGPRTLALQRPRGARAPLPT